MKLKCQDHERRVVVLESGTVVHRNGDGSKCNSFAISIGERVFWGPMQKHLNQYIDLKKQ